MEEQSFAPQSWAAAWDVNEIRAKVSVVHFFSCRPEGVDGQYVKHDVLENSMYKIQVRYRLITSHNSCEVFRLPNGLM